MTKHCVKCYAPSESEECLSCGTKSLIEIKNSFSIAEIEEAIKFAKKHVHTEQDETGLNVEVVTVEPSEIRKYLITSQRFIHT